MINKFNYYLEKGHVKRKTSDPVESKSLLDKATSRINYFKKITEEDASIVLENAYEGIRESAQSLMSLKGYKPYSHEATISFIKEFYKEFTEEDINNFDRFRQLRSDSVYRAVHISKEEAELCLMFVQVFVNKVKKIHAK